MNQFDNSSTNTNTSFHNIEQLNNELQNVNLDSNISPKVSIYFKSDGNQDPKMSNPLSNYFGNADEIDSFNLVGREEKPEEPVVCRIFADTPQPKKTNVDPTSNFFDAIMQPTLTGELGSGIDLGLSNYEETYSGTAILGGSEVNRRRDAWIPSEKTREVLIAVATSTPGSFFPDPSHLTMPGVILEEDLNDMLQEVVTQYLGAAEATQRKILTAGDVTQDDRGLRELIQANCYRAAINLTGRLLKIYGQGIGSLNRPSKHTPHSLQLWFTRIALLVKIKSFTLAEKEAEVFAELDNPDLYFQFYPDKFGGRPGSIVPFAFRILLAELPMHCNKPRDSMVKLNKILATVRQILDNLKEDGLSEDGNPMELNESDRGESVQLWLSRLQRVQHSIVNCALFQENYSVATQTIEGLLKDQSLKTPQQVALHSALGRILLQVGDVLGAEQHFEKSREFSGSQTDIRNIIDKSLVAISQNNFTEAYEILVEARKTDPANIMILNNMSVCLLYTGKLKEAISLLENAINANPTRGLNDSLLLNLCTLYELESSHSVVKKLNLLRQLAKYKADAGMNVYQCLKLPVDMNKKKSI